MTTPDQGITELLLDWNAGHEKAPDRLMRVVYEELRRIAGAQLRSERVDHTLQATALVNEAYMRLIDQNRVHWHNRAHFFAIAARMMRRILVDHARRQRAGKRGGGATLLVLDEALTPARDAEVDLVLLDDVLQRLETLDERAARLVEMRYFGGLTIEETGEALGISPATVKREWTTARAWLHRELSAGAPS